jgi:transposase-like protein
MARSDRAEWQKRVERWLDSGLSAKEFAAETGLKPSTLSYWKWRLRAEQRKAEGTAARSTPRGKPKDPEPVPTFFEVSSGMPVTAPLELVISGAVTVRVPIGFDDQTLGRVLRVLGASR